MMSMSLYHETASSNIYTPLRQWQTRIIALRPGDTCDPLVSDLSVVDLIAAEGLGFHDSDTIIQYEAVSYSWGREKFDEILTCNGNELQISSHLASGLRQLRQTSSTRYLWVDAVCINQFDELEKSRQVRNMLKIFEKAITVIAWLGVIEPDFIPFGDCQGCGKCLCDRIPTKASSRDSSGVPQSKRRKLSAMDEQHGRLTDQMNSFDDVDSASLQQPRSHERASVETFISRSWFSRTWVRQEVFAAREIIVQLGHYQTNLYDLIHQIASFCGAGDEHPALFLISYSARNGDLDSHLVHAVGHVAASQKDMVTRQDEHAEEDENMHLNTLGTIQYSFATHMLSILQTAAHSHVLDPRDRVYGALGMIFHPHFKTRIDKSQPMREFPAELEASYPIEYGKSISEVYRDVIKTIVHDSGTLDVLFVAQDRTDWNPDLPTWALDWRRAIPRMIARRNWRRYEPWETGSLIATFENNILHVHGSKRGVVKTRIYPMSIPPQALNGLGYTSLEDCFLRNNVVNRRVTKADLKRDCSYVLRWIHLKYNMTTWNNTHSVAEASVLVLVSSLAKEGDWAVTLADLNHQSTSNQLLILRPIDKRPGHFSCLGPAIFVHEKVPLFKDEPEEEFEQFLWV
jgi:hypothetical protein